MAIRRKLDDLGRVVLPQEMRNELKFAKNQPIQIEVQNEKIILTKATKGCDLCGKEDNLVSKGKYLLCGECLLEIVRK